MFISSTRENINVEFFIGKQKKTAMKEMALSEAQEKRWVELAKKNDLDAFNHLVLSYQDAAFSFASWMLGDDLAAEEVVQAAFLAAYGHIKQFHGRSFRTWLLKIIRRSCMDELHHRIHHTRIPLEQKSVVNQVLENVDGYIDPDSLPGDFIDVRVDQKRIEQSMQQLANPLREVLILMDIEAYDYREAAAILNIPPETIKSRLIQARASFDALLKKNTLACDLVTRVDNRFRQLNPLLISKDSNTTSPISCQDAHQGWKA